MFTALKQIKNQKGFTLIELLVVIGILGILATALVTTIDPFEQLKKAQDANVKNALVEYIEANLRYYTTHNNLPWSVSAASGRTCPGDTNGFTMASTDNNLSLSPASPVTGPGMAGCVDVLIDDGELKSQFSNATGITQYIISGGNSNTVTACYQPQSKSQQRDVNTIYGVNGSVTSSTASCKAKGGASDCFWCTEL
jgi:prepilin-type N-terminal cleavage/methylation domain-containing protein